VEAATPQAKEGAVRAWADASGVTVSPRGRITACAGRGLRVITYDRPGYGLSTPQPGRRICDAGADIAIIADNLSIPRFGIAGISAGGPCALAAAALLPDRVTRCATIVAGISADREDVHGRAVADPETMQTEWTEFMAWVDAGLRGVTVSDRDRAMFAETAVEVRRQGSTGFIEDTLCDAAGWGFDLDQIAQPVRCLVGRDTPGSASTTDDDAPICSRTPNS